MLVSCGADVNLAGPDRKTALHLAAKHGMAEAAKVGFKEMAGPTLKEQQAEKALGDGIFLGAGVYALTIPNFYFRQE